MKIDRTKINMFPRREQLVIKYGKTSEEVTVQLIPSILKMLVRFAAPSR
jgi:hypothetical protein